MTTLRVTFLDNNYEPYDIFYLLYNSDLAKRWMNIVRENQLNSNHTIHTAFINYAWNDIDKLLTKINSVVDEINQIYDRQLIKFSTGLFLENKILNDLHEEYEIYGDRVESLISSNLFNETLHDNFLQLNEHIHTCEELLANYDSKKASMSVLFDLYPQGIYSPILEKDKLFLTNEFKWGRLYLGYNTLGKDWLEVSLHNDTDVIKRGQVRIQERFAAEAWLNFGSTGHDKTIVSKFLNWYEELSEDLKEKVPVNDMNALSLGRYEIGKIIIDDKLLAYHSNEEDWTIPNSKIAQQWNLDVFSTFQKIINIKLLDES
jgi:hypothetical protein